MLISIFADFATILLSGVIGSTVRTISPLARFFFGSNLKDKQNEKREGENRADWGACDKRGGGNEQKT